MAEIYKGVWEDDQGNKLYSDNDTETTRDSSGIPLNNGGDLSEASVNFTVGTSRKALTPKARFKALMGDIAKWLTDLGPAAFYKVADDFTTTAENYLFTARKGKQLKDEIDGINRDLQEVGMTAEEKKQLQEIYDRIVTYAKYIVDLGSGTTFDVSGYEGYQNFTISNFIVSVDSASSTWTGYGDTGTNSCSATVIKNYNASSGILTLSGLSASRVGPGEIKLSIASRVYLITDPI